MLLEFFRRGQRIFCTVTNWRLERPGSRAAIFRKDYFLGNECMNLSGLRRSDARPRTRC